MKVSHDWSRKYYFCRSFCLQMRDKYILHLGDYTKGTSGISVYWHRKSYTWVLPYLSIARCSTALAWIRTGWACGAIWYPATTRRLIACLCHVACVGTTLTPLRELADDVHIRSQVIIITFWKFASFRLIASWAFETYFRGPTNTRLWKGGAAIRQQDWSWQVVESQPHSSSSP